MSKPELRIRPSASDRWTRCTGSVWYDLNMPNDAGAAALRGTALHEEAEKRLKTPGITWHPKLEAVLDEHMVDSYVQYVRRAEQEWDGSNIWIEQELTLNKFCYGTADAVVTHRNDIRLIDLKTGQKRVRAEGNTQLMLYLLMAVRHFGIDRYAGRMTVEVFQPTQGTPADVHHVTGEELREFEWNVSSPLGEIQLAHYEDEWKFNPSFEACHYCAGRAVCKARRDDLMSDFDQRIETSLDDDQLSEILLKAANLKSWIDAVEVYATKRAVEGLEIPGFALGEKQTYRKWSDPESAEQILIDYGFDDEDELWSRKLASPARVLNGIDDPNLEEELKALVVKPTGAPVLKKQS